MNTSFTELVECTAPIQLAGMGPVCTDDLCAAVSQAGGLGMITVAATTPDSLQTRLDHIASLTANPIGANFLIPIVDRDCLQVASRAVHVVDFFWGDPDPALVKVVHEEGALVSWQVGSADEAVAAESVGCDFIIAQGIEAGGHIRGSHELLPLLSQVLDRVSIPVLAAGGIEPINRRTMQQKGRELRRRPPVAPEIALDGPLEPDNATSARAVLAKTAPRWSSNERYPLVSPMSSVRSLAGTAKTETSSGRHTWTYSARRGTSPANAISEPPECPPTRA